MNGLFHIDNIFTIHLYCSMYQNMISFKGWIMLHLDASTTFCVFICQWRHGLFLPFAHCKQHYKQMAYKHLFELFPSIPMSIYIGWENLSHMIILCLDFWGSECSFFSNINLQVKSYGTELFVEMFFQLWCVNGKYNYKIFKLYTVVIWYMVIWYILGKDSQHLVG